MSVLRVENLTKKFETAVPLRNVSFSVEKGDVISIIGPSGTGKTTLLRCINGLEKITEGHVYFHDEDLLSSHKTLSKLRRKVGMVFQSYNLFDHKTVVENVMMAPVDLGGVSKQEAYNEALSLLKKVGMDTRALQFPSQLSGGQKQRVAIARCLAMHPEVILFDEPTSALDPLMVQEVLDIIKDLSKEGITVMVVTHEMSFARKVANRVFYMDEGGLYEEGTPEEIFDHPKREKTKIFMNKSDNYNYDVCLSGFDLYNYNSEFEEFAQKAKIPRKQLQCCEIVTEEMLLNILKELVSDDQVYISKEYRNADRSLVVSFRYRGKDIGLAKDINDGLSFRLVESLAKDMQVSQDGDCYKIEFVL